MLDALGHRRRVRREPAPARAAPRSGSSTRARPPPTAGPASTTCGPACSRTSTPASTPCGAATSPARAAGTATGCRSRSRSRRSSASRASTRSRTYGIAAFNRACRESVQRYVADWSSRSPRRIGMWLDTDDAYWTLDNDVHRERVVAVPPDVGRRRHLRGPQGRPLLRALRHRAVEPRARPARRVPDVTEPSVYVRFPVVDRDFDLLVWTTTPWTLVVERRRRGRPRRRVRARARRRRRPRPRAGARRASPTCSATTPRSSARSRSPTSSASATSARSTSSPLDRSRGARVVAADFVTVDDGSGIVHLAPAFGEIDREVAERRRPADAQPGRARGDVRRPPRSARRTPGQFVKDADPAIIDALARRGPARARRRLHALVPALLALRHAAHLLGQAHVVRAHLGAQGRRCCARTRRSAGTRSTSSTAASATGSRTTSTGRSPATASGARRSRCGAATTAGTDTCVGSVAELAERSGRDLADLDLHRPAVDDVTIDVPEVRATGRATRRAGARRVVRLRLDARRAVPLPVRARRAVRAALPRRLHLRGDRPDPRAGSTRCSR